MKNSILRSAKFKAMGPSVMALMMTFSVAGAANADAAGRSFQAYVAQGYTEVANYAAFQMGNKEVAKHFQNKAQLAQSGGLIDPENPSNFTSRWGVDVAKARNLLIKVLSSDQPKKNPEMAAVALVNFDCFAAGVGSNGKSCLNAFTGALAALKPVVAVANVDGNRSDDIGGDPGDGNSGNPSSSDQVASDGDGSTGDGSNGRSSGSSSNGGSPGEPGGASSGGASGGPGANPP